MNIGHKTHKNGFTLIEVILSVSLMLFMLGFITQTLFRGQQQTSFTETAELLVRDMREQQIMVMQGDTFNDHVLSDYSIRFENDRYILFPGSVYVSTNPNNRVVLLEPTMRFSSITFPGSTLTFARGSGDIRSYTATTNSVTLTDSDTNSQKIISVNEHGVVFVQ